MFTYLVLLFSPISLSVFAICPVRYATIFSIFCCTLDFPLYAESADILSSLICRLWYAIDRTIGIRIDGTQEALFISSGIRNFCTQLVTQFYAILRSYTQLYAVLRSITQSYAVYADSVLWKDHKYFSAQLFNENTICFCAICTLYFVNSQKKKWTVWFECSAASDKCVIPGAGGFLRHAVKLVAIRSATLLALRSACVQCRPALDARAVGFSLEWFIRSATMLLRSGTTLIRSGPTLIRSALWR